MYNNAKSCASISKYVCLRSVFCGYSLLPCHRISIHRKSASLSPSTRHSLVQALAQSIQGLVAILESSSETVPQAFRDAWACHVYMLYTFLFIFESEAKGIDNNRSKQQQQANNNVLQLRQIAADAMLAAAHAMAQHRPTLWQRGVSDEAVVLLPSRIAYTLLEVSTGVLARKAACGDQALQMLAVTVDGALTSESNSLLNTITAALMDLMHSFEHMAPLTAELCTIVSEEQPRLAVELIREIGRLEGSADAKSGAGTKNVAPFVSSLAEVRPRLVLTHLTHLLPQLDAEPYNLRSAIVTAVAHILVSMGQQQQADAEQPSSTTPMQQDVTKSRDTLLDLLLERAYDVSSYTRSTVLKAWILLVQQQGLPKERILPVTTLAMDRLQDKTVMVRKQAMQVCIHDLVFF